MAQEGDAKTEPEMPGSRTGLKFAGVPGRRRARAYGERLQRLLFPQIPASPVVGYAFAAACCSLAFVVRLLLDPGLRDHSPLLLFALAVAVSAMRGGVGPGLFATLAGAIGALYFFPPVGAFFSIAAEYHSTAALQLAVFFLIGMILSWVGGELLSLRWKAVEFARQRNEILESITDGFAALDKNCRFVYLNVAAARLVQSPRAQVAGKSIWEEIPELRGTLVAAKFRRVLDQRVAARFEFLLHSSNQWFEFHAHPAGNRGLTVYFSDISARKSVELRLRQTLAERDAALENIRVLSGLLPICAACKKIRDDQGHWQPMESYISGHSSAQFSHSMCPECAIQYYGELGRRAAGE
jgi:PAS domain S-box-containing protein